MGKPVNRINGSRKNNTATAATSQLCERKVKDPDGVHITKDEGVQQINSYELNSNVTLLALAVFFVTIVVYVQTLQPSLSGGDSGELIVAAHEVGVAHPPGYPLFTMWAKLFMTIIPVGSVAWRVNFSSAVCGAGCSSFLFLTIYRMTKSRGAGLFGAFLFAFSRLVWTWSICAEVFALNNLLVSMLLFTAVIFDTCQKESLSKVCMWGAFLSGLCLANQHTSVLYIIIIVPWVMFQLWTFGELSVSLLLSSACCFSLGVLPYVYLPLSSALNIARWTWGDQSSVWGFLTHLLRREYGTLDLLKDHEGQGFASGLQAYLEHAWTDLTYLVCVLLVVSVLTTYLRCRRGQFVRVLLVFYFMLLLYLGFFCWRANLDINKPLFFRVVERFWLQSDLLVCVLAAVCYGDVFRYVSERFDFGKQKFELALAVIMIAFQLNRWWHVCDQSKNMVVHDFAKQTLASFPNGSIVLTKGDLPSNSLRYFHLCENVRPDLTVFDQEVLTYEWSLQMTRKFYPNLVFPGDQWQPYSGKTPDGRKAFTFRDLIHANYRERPIYACIGVQEHERSWQTAYSLWPFGVCSKLVKKDKALVVEEWAKATDAMGQQWSYQLSPVDDGSWEHVANSEMWRGRTATAFFFLELAMELSHKTKEATSLLLKSYEIYSRELARHKECPAYWHRNFAIVCEHLSRRDTPLTQRDLLQKTVHHFTEYLRLEPINPDHEKIQHAVDTLQNYLVSTATEK